MKTCLTAHKLEYCDVCGKSIWKDEQYTYREDMSVGVSWIVCAVCEPLPRKGKSPVLVIDGHFQVSEAG